MKRPPLSKQLSAIFTLQQEKAACSQSLLSLSPAVVMQSSLPTDISGPLAQQ